jgi:hypothetical protein
MNIAVSHAILRKLTEKIRDWKRKIYLFPVRNITNRNFFNNSKKNIPNIFRKILLGQKISDNEKTFFPVQKNFVHCPNFLSEQIFRTMYEIFLFKQKNP